MKKRAIMFAAILAASTLTGCSASNTGTSAAVSGEDDTTATETTGGYDSSVIVSGASDSEVSENIDTAFGKESVSEENAEADNAITNAHISNIYHNGTWYFTSFDSNGTENHFLYVVDNKELIAFEREGDVLDVSGYLVAYENGIIKNIKTNEVYCDPDEGMNYIETRGFIRGNSLVFADDGTALIKKVVADFDSNSVYYGVLNSDGTWRNELNENTELVGIDGRTELKYLANGFIACDLHDCISYFCIDNNSFLDNELLGNHWLGTDYVYSNDNGAYFMSSTMYYPTLGLYTNIEDFYYYDKSTNTITEIIENSVDERKFYCMPSGRYIAISNTGSTHIAYDMEAQMQYEFSIDGYNIYVDKYDNPVFSIVGDTYLFECIGADSNNYICAINTAGGRVIEPREMAYQFTVGDKYICTINGSPIMFDSVTGEETPLPGSLVTTISGSLHDYGDGDIIIIEDEEGSKLLNLNDPDNPYSPFDTN